MKENSSKFLSNEYLHGNNIYFVLSEIDKHYPLHFHEFYEIELPVDGNGYEIINGNHYDIAKNTIFLLHPTDYHSIEATTPLKIFNIAFTSSLIDEENITYFLDYQNEIVIELTENKLKQVRSIIEVIQSIFNGHRTNKELILTHLLNALLLVIIGSNQLKGNIKTSKNSDILKYIHQNFAKNPTLDELSKHCGYQKNYFCEYFKRKTGLTYKEYLSNVKINYSKKLLKLSNKTIKEIALECGFNSANNYIRKFKAHTSLTPKEFRQLYIKSID